MTKKQMKLVDEAFDLLSKAKERLLQAGYKEDSRAVEDLKTMQSNLPVYADRLHSMTKAENKAWDAQIKADAASGKLDHLIHDGAYFTCPKCGSHHFGRDTADDGRGGVAALETVRCHGGWSSRDPQIDVCHWRGKWPQ